MMLVIIGNNEAWKALGPELLVKADLLQQLLLSLTSIQVTFKLLRIETKF